MQYHDVTCAKSNSVALQPLPRKFLETLLQLCNITHSVTDNCFSPPPSKRSPALPQKSMRDVCGLPLYLTSFIVFVTMFSRGFFCGAPLSLFVCFCLVHFFLVSSIGVRNENDTSRQMLGSDIKILFSVIPLSYACRYLLRVRIHPVTSS